LIAQYHASAARLNAQVNMVENRARDDFRDLWDCGAEIKNAEVGHFVESRRSDASEAHFRVHGRVTPRLVERVVRSSLEFDPV
jgi:hypothetical protein